MAVVLAVGGWLLDRQMLQGLEVLHEGEFRELLGLLGDPENLTAAGFAPRTAPIAAVCG